MAGRAAAPEPAQRAGRWADGALRGGGVGCVYGGGGLDEGVAVCVWAYGVHGVR